MPPSDEDTLENTLKSLENMIPDLDSITNEVNRITESVDKHFKAVASTLLDYPVAASIRETIQKSPWLYERPQPSPPPPPPVLPLGYVATAQRWVSEHRAVTAAVVAFVGTGIFIIWRRRRADRMRRRAKRAKNGSRTEVVILAGSPHSPLTRSLSMDLERRGFIVYIPVSSLIEEQYIHSQGRGDIRPMHLDLTSDVSTANAVEKFTSYIRTPQYPLPHTPPHSLELSSLILLPPLNPPADPISTLSASSWSDALNAHLIAPFAIIRAFLPLLRSWKACLITLTPSIIPSLQAPSYAPESVIAASMDAYMSTLRKEISTKDLNIVQLKLGSFDYGTAYGTDGQVVARTEHPGWDAAARAKHMKGMFSKMKSEKARGSPLRELHNTVFDSMTRGKGRGSTVFVGRGARTYNLVGRWVPGSLVGWMMGLRQGEDGAGFAGNTRPESTTGSQEWEKVEYA